MARGRARRTVAGLAAATAVAGSTLLAVPSAQADGILEMHASCETGEAQAQQTFSIDSAGNWRLDVHAHNKSRLVRDFQLTTDLYPRSDPGTNYARFWSRGTVGAGNRGPDRTRDWTYSGSDPYYAAIYPALRAGGTAKTKCRITRSNGIWPDPGAFTTYDSETPFGPQ